MAEENKEKFESIYGDSENEFDVEDVSDETTSIPKEVIEEAIAEKEEKAEPTEEKPVEATPVEEAPSEETAPAESAPEEPKAEDPAPEPAAEPAEEEADDEDAASGITFEDRAYDRHHRHDDDPDDVYADKDDEETGDEKVGILSYILHAILFTIPVIGTIVMLVYIISDKKNSHLRHFAQIWLVTLLIIAIGAWAALTILGIV